MDLFSWFRRPQLESKHSVAGSAISAMGVGVPVWATRDYSSFAQEGYRCNSTVFRCVKLIASGAATVPWLLYGQNDDEVEKHPLLNLLNNPNPMASGGAFFEAVYAYLLISGNSYIERVGPDSKAPKELWTARPDRMQVIPGPRGIPQGYEYTANGQKLRWDADWKNGNGPILHLKEFNPLDDWYGMSRMEAAAFGIDRHNSASAHNKALLDNGARPSGALVFKPIQTSPGQYSFAPEAAIEAAKTRLESTYAGPVNAGRPLAMGGDIEWVEMGMSPRDMDFKAGTDDSARDICNAFGVSHLLVVPGSSTYNNVREAKLDLWEDTILPLVDRLVDGLNNWLCPLFGEGLKLGVDLDEISALEYRRESKRKTVIDLLDKGVIDREEAREALQYDPKPEMVAEPDASTVTALFNAVGTVGIGPLAKYLRSMGLIDAKMTDDQVVDAACAYLEEVGPTPEEEAAALALEEGESSADEG
jgi:HK97 family phage portal protein